MKIKVGRRLDECPPLDTAWDAEPRWEVMPEGPPRFRLTRPTGPQELIERDAPDVPMTIYPLT
jgi:hypothetical protein